MGRRQMDGEMIDGEKIDGDGQWKWRYVQQCSLALPLWNMIVKGKNLDTVYMVKILFEAKFEAF